jgi:predicted secreted protein
MGRFYLNPEHSLHRGNLLVAISTALAIYFIVWWMVLFAVLPWGVRSQEESGEIAHGTDPGAPAIPKLKQKLVWTTLISGLVFALFAVAYGYRQILLDALAALMGVTR